MNFETGMLFAGRYRLDASVGSGGFAEVFRATDTKTGEVVALKIYPRLDAAGVEALRQEYQHTRNLRHPHLLVADHFEEHEGCPGLKMPFCAGGTAADLRGGLDEPSAARFLQQIGGALAYLHGQGLTHNDQKPSNFVCDEAGNFFLADLGLSQKMAHTVKMATHRMGDARTSSSALGLTPACYRPPELYQQKSLRSHPMPASDVWSLGAALFELLDGEVPFGEFGGLMLLNPENGAPSLPERFSGGLNGLVQACLARNAGERPSAEALRAAGDIFLKTGVWPDMAPKAAEPVVPEPAPVRDSGATVRGDAPGLTDGGGTERGKNVGWMAVVLAILGLLCWEKCGKEPPPPPPTPHIVAVPQPASTPPSISDTTPVRPTPPTTTPPAPGKIAPQNQNIEVVEPKKNPKALCFKVDYLQPSKFTLRIEKVEIWEHETRVFLFHPEDANTTCNLYGPGQKAPFKMMLSEGGEKHVVKAVSGAAFGEGIKIPAGGMHFVLHFDAIPDNTRSIFWLGEGASPVAGATYWNFENLTLNKQ